MPRDDANVHVMDIHAGEMAKAAWDFFFHFLEQAEALGEDVIIEGGWAVAAHGSPIPSIDLDVLVHDASPRAFYDLLHGEGAHARTPGASLLDWSELGTKNTAWATSAGYVRKDLLANNTTDIRVRAPDGRERTIRAPNLAALTVMKLKAFRDRELQYRARIDRTLGASFDAAHMADVHEDPDYLLRKAAKDLVDVGFLWNKATEPERKAVRDLLAAHGLLPLVRRALAAPDPDVLSAADYLIARHRLGWRAEDVARQVRQGLP